MVKVGMDTDSPGNVSFYSREPRLSYSLSWQLCDSMQDMTHNHNIMHTGFRSSMIVELAEYGLPSHFLMAYFNFLGRSILGYTLVEF